MNKDQKLIAEAYDKVLEASLSYDREGNANATKELKKFTYELLQPVYVKDPNSKYGWINTGKFQSRAGVSGPNISHVFASSKEEAMKKIVDRLPGVDNVEKRTVIKSEEPADPKEVEYELEHSKVMSDYYSSKSKTGGYSGD